MTAPPSSPDPSQTIVVDASVAINLNASAHSSSILAAFPNSFAVTDIVVGELQTCVRTGREDGRLLDALITAGRLTVAKLGATGLRHFESMVIGDAIDTLDDGEAATIACALEKNAMALIDERKARRICGQRFPALRLLSTVQLLRDTKVLKALGNQALREAVANALAEARMQVDTSDRAWVVDLIGIERAAAYPSLSKALR